MIGYKIKNINMKKSYIIFGLVLFITSCVTTNQVFFSDPNYLNSDEFSSAETINEAYKETYSENTLEDQDTILENDQYDSCLLYTSPSPRDMRRSRMPSSA